jgi:hypothetical protein
VFEQLGYDGTPDSAIGGWLAVGLGAGVLDEDLADVDGVAGGGGCVL